MEFKKFKTFLFSRGETYDKASKKIGIAISSFSKKINGQASWDYRELSKIKKVYELDDSTFIEFFFNK